MDKNKNDLFNRVIGKNRYAILRNFLENNKQDIIGLIKSKAKYKDIFETFKEIADINIDYVRFCQILSEFKLKYIYNQTDITPKENIKLNVEEQPKILAAKISEIEPKAQPQEQEKEEIKANAACDAVPVNNSISNNDEPKKLSRRERLLARINAPDEEKIIDIQKNQEKFVWKPSIKE